MLQSSSAQMLLHSWMWPDLLFLVSGQVCFSGLLKTEQTLPVLYLLILAYPSGFLFARCCLWTCILSPYSAHTFPFFRPLFPGKCFSVQAYWNSWELFIQMDIKRAFLMVSILHLSNSFSWLLSNFESNWLLLNFIKLLQFREYCHST